MKGLLLKDLFIVKNYSKTLVVLLLFYAGFGAFTNQNFFITSMIPFLSVFVSISAFSYDDSCHWNQYALTLPVNRRQLVAARYLFVLLLTVGGALLATLLTVVTSPLTGGLAVLGGSLFAVAIVSCAGLFFASLILPLLYWLGAEKGRLLLMLIVMLPVAAVFVISKLDLPLPQLANPELLLGVAFPLTAVVGTTVSYFVSQAILARKEF